MQQAEERRSAFGVRRSTNDKGRSAIPLWVAIVVVGLSSAIYLPALRYDFVWDDSTVIKHNVDLDVANPILLLGRSFALMNSRDVESRNQYYRPLVTMSFWADKRVWGLKPFGFHLTNILMNAVAGLLFAFMLAELFGVTWPALLGGLAFMLHPTHVESVSFTAGRTDILMAIFMIVAFLALTRFRRRPAWGSLALVAVSYGLALLSKETAVVFPVLALFYLGWPQAAGREPPSAAKSKPRVKAGKTATNSPEAHSPVFSARSSAFTWTMLGLLVGISIIYLLIRASVLKGYAPAWTGVSPGQRLLLVMNAFGRYVLLGVVPFFHKVVYPGPAQFAVPGWPTAVSLAGAAIFIFFILRSPFAVRRSAFDVRRTTTLGAVWFVLFILPACDWFPPGVSYLAERLLYLPVAGLIVLLIALVRRQTRNRPMLASGVLRFIALPVMLYIVAMGWDSFHRMPVWQSNLVLYSTIAREEPDSPDAHYNLGNTLQAGGDVNGAIREFRRAIALRPNDAEEHNNLGLTLLDSNDLNGAIAQFQEAVRLAPAYALARENLANGLTRAGNFPEADAEYRRTLALQPDLAAAHNNLGKVLTNMGQLDSAAMEFRLSLQYQPNSALGHYNLAQVLAALGRAGEAEQEYRQALKIQPDYGAAQEGLKALGITH